MQNATTEGPGEGRKVASSESVAAPPRTPPGPSRPPPRSPRGFGLRLLTATTLPVAFLAAATVVVVRWLAPESGDSFPADTFIPMFLALGAVALLGAGFLAYVLDRGLREQLGLVGRTLASGRIGDLRGLASSRGWSGLADLAREAQDALGRSQEGLRGAEELKALQTAADDLLSKLREWGDTEIAPSLIPEGPLSQVISALLLLAEHLEERTREAHEVAELARESLLGACETIERAGRDAERGSREVTGLLTALGEVRRIGSEVSGTVRKASERATGDSGTDSPGWLPSALEDLDRALESAERSERRSLRAALEVAALSLSRRQESSPERGLALVGELKEGALESRFAYQRLSELRSRLRMHESERAARPLASEQALEALGERLSSWSKDALARAERLSTLVQRFSAQSESALAAARVGAEEIGGLANRFESQKAGTPAEGHAETGSGTEDVSEPERTQTTLGWGSTPRPLRLLTRGDLLPDDGEEDGGEDDLPSRS